ncbi:hypothetical protein ACJONP_04905, partial [Mycoplasmopsis synoviae]
GQPISFAFSLVALPSFTIKPFNKELQSLSLLFFLYSFNFFISLIYLLISSICSCVNLVGIFIEILTKLFIAVLIVLFSVSLN